ncbi:MAG: PqqD family protein [Clostridia bacterium]
MEKYILNKRMQEMQLGKGEGTVLYDPETENTHVLDDIALDIIDLFRDATTVDEVITELSSIYDATKETIDRDVQEFIEMALKNQILIPAV